MNVKHKLLMVLAIVHIGLAALGAAAIPLGDPQNVPLIEWYRHISGADNSFAFFAPGVGAQERVRFVMEDADGKQWTDSLRMGLNHEANLCFETVPFVLASMDDKTAWSMLGSMAETMMSRHPAATKVIVKVETFASVWDTQADTEPNIDFPTIHEYKRGKRPEWLLKYEVSFPPQTENTVAATDFERVQS